MDAVSFVAALTAPLTVAATAFTAYFNRRYDFKQKQLELYETRRLDAVNNFADAFAKLYKASVNHDTAVRCALAATYMVIPYYEEPVRERLNDFAFRLRADVGREEIYDSFEECLSLVSTSTTQPTRSLRRPLSGISKRLQRK